MATHSSVLAWRIPGMGEPGGLPSMGSHRVGHDCSNLAAAATIKVLFFFFFNLASLIVRYMIRSSFILKKTIIVCLFVFGAYFFTYVPL